MMGHLRRATALLALSISVAAAQPKPLMPPTAEQKAEIEKLAKQAIAKSQKGDHDGAIKDYLDAYTIYPVNLLLSSLGHEYKAAKKPYEALKYFCMYLEKEPTGPAASYVLAEASAIWKELGKKEGEVCVKKPDPPPVDTPPDNGVTGTAPIKEPPPPPPKENGSGLRVAGLGIAGVGVIALGAGFVFGTKAADRSKQIDAGPPLDGAGNQLDWGPHPEVGWDGIAKLEADGKKYEKFQIGLTVVGGAMVIGGTAMYFLARKKPTETNFSAAATRDSAGFVVNGRF